MWSLITMNSTKLETIQNTALRIDQILPLHTHTFENSRINIPTTITTSHTPIPLLYNNIHHPDERNQQLHIHHTHQNSQNITLAHTKHETYTQLNEAYTQYHRHYIRSNSTFNQHIGSIT